MRQIQHSTDSELIRDIPVVKFDMYDWKEDESDDEPEPEPSKLCTLVSKVPCYYCQEAVTKCVVVIKLIEIIFFDV